MTNGFFSDGSPVAQDRPSSLVSAQHTVASALAPLSQDARMRVLLSSAVLFGLIKPGEPVLPESRRVEIRHRHPSGDSIRTRVDRELARRGETSPAAIADALDLGIESVRAALSKLTSEGKARRVSVGRYECTSHPISTSHGKDNG